MNDVQERLGLRIVSDGDAAALSRRSIHAAMPVQAIPAIIAVWTSNAAGTASAAASTATAGAAGAAIGAYRQRTALGIDQVKLLLTLRRDTHLQQRMCARAKRYTNLDGRSVSARTAIAPISPIRSIRAVSARRRVIRVDRARAAAAAIEPVGA